VVFVKPFLGPKGSWFPPFRWGVAALYDTDGSPHAAPHHIPLEGSAEPESPALTSKPVRPV